MNVLVAYFNIVHSLCAGSGYENPPQEWDTYPPYMSVEGLEVGPPVSRKSYPLS